jgi:hypothetical protein
MIVVAACAGAYTAATDCTYTDPIVTNGCNIGGTGPVNITCRMLANFSGTSNGTEGSCEYLWCDNARSCQHNNNFLRLKRVKKFVYNSVPTGCWDSIILTSVEDKEPWCCDCTMPAPPEWPSD